MDFQISNIVSCESLDSFHFETFDLLQTNELYNESMVLNNDTTSMSFDDNLLQAA